jgi:cytochrome c-type biogenesis protein
MGYRRINMTNITIPVVFAAGLASFLSPCMLPLLPVYLGYLSGKISGGTYSRRTLIKNSLYFCLGLSLVFVGMGATASSIGRFLSSYKYILTKAAGVVIIFFGLFHMGIIRPGFMYREKRFEARYKKSNWLNSLVFGAAYAFGWTPCIGPILGSVLSLAGISQSAPYGAFLLFIYSLGLSIPFIVTAAFMDFLSAKLKAVQKYSRIINIAGGIILVLLGIAIYTGWINRLLYL